MRSKKIKIPTYRDTYPAHLATAAELEALGLRPGTQEPIAL